MSSTEGDEEFRAVAAPILEMRNIAKRFDATQALEDVSLALYPGEIHALLGENGAGKSTLIKIMTGVHQPDRGEILLDGEPVAIGSAAEAQRLGVAAIYQEPMIFPDLTVAENIFIGHRDRGAIVGWRRMFREAEAILGRARRRASTSQPGARPDARRTADGRDRQGDLAERPRPDHGRADRLAVRPRGRRSCSGSCATCATQGVAILFISHRMEEVFEIADRVTVLRDGRLDLDRARAPRSTPRRAIPDMVGREIGAAAAATATRSRASCCSRCAGLGREGVFEGVELRPAARRGAGLRRAGRRPPHRRRAGPVRHRAGDRGHDRARRQGR